MIRTVRSKTLLVAMVALAIAGCTTPQGSANTSAKDPDSGAATAKRFQDTPREGRTAVESAIELSEKYAKLSDQSVALRQENQRLTNENESLRQQLAALDTKLKQTQKELTEANDLLIEMLTELNHWKSNILGFRGEMRDAAKAQLEALLKVLEILGGEAEAGALEQRHVDTLQPDANDVSTIETPDTARERAQWDPVTSYGEPGSLEGRNRSAAVLCFTSLCLPRDPFFWRFWRQACSAAVLPAVTRIRWPAATSWTRTRILEPWAGSRWWRWTTSPASRRSSAEITEALHLEIQKQQVFGLVVVHQDDPAWRSLQENLDSLQAMKQLVALRETLRSNGLLVGTITQYQPYPHMVIGLRLKLLDLTDGQLIWGVEQVWDSTDKTIQKRIQRYYKQQARSGNATLSQELTIVSSLNFCKFVAYEVASTLRPRQEQ